MAPHHYGAKMFIPDNFVTVPMRFEGDGALNEPWQWGTPIEWDNQGRAVTYKLTLRANPTPNDDDDLDDAILTHVFWAEPGAVASDDIEPPTDHTMRTNPE